MQNRPGKTSSHIFFVVRSRKFQRSSLRGENVEISVMFTLILLITNVLPPEAMEKKKTSNLWMFFVFRCQPSKLYLQSCHQSQENLQTAKRWALLGELYEQKKRTHFFFQGLFLVCWDDSGDLPRISRPVEASPRGCRTCGFKMWNETNTTMIFPKWATLRDIDFGWVLPWQMDSLLGIQSPKLGIVMEPKYFAPFSHQLAPRPVHRQSCWPATAPGCRINSRFYVSGGEPTLTKWEMLGEPRL